MRKCLKDGEKRSENCSEKAASQMPSTELRRRLSLMTTAELLEAMNKQIVETQNIIEILTEEIQLRLMERAEE